LLSRIDLTSKFSLHHSAAQELEALPQSNQCPTTKGLMHFAKGGTIPVSGGFANGFLAGSAIGCFMGG
jgi:hypothetical protein